MKTLFSRSILHIIIIIIIVKSDFRGQMQKKSEKKKLNFGKNFNCQTSHARFKFADIDADSC